MDTGLRNRPLHAFTQNQICAIVALACELTTWMQLLAFTDASGNSHEAHRWEPKSLRLRLLSTAARIARTGRRIIVHLACEGAWTTLLHAGLIRLRAHTARLTATHQTADPNDPGPSNCAHPRRQSVLCRRRLQESTLARRPPTPGRRPRQSHDRSGLAELDPRPTSKAAPDKTPRQRTRAPWTFEARRSLEDAERTNVVQLSGSCESMARSWCEVDHSPPQRYLNSFRTGKLICGEWLLHCGRNGGCF